MFERIQKLVSNYYDDDARHVFERHGGKLYFVWSNRHNGQLFIIICDETQELLSEIVAKAVKSEKDDVENGIDVYAIKKLMLMHGGIKLGEDSMDDDDDED